MFIGRERELAELQALYEAEEFQLVVLWGRRRVGKTTLISEFCRDKENIFFTALETSDRENLENLSRAILSDTAGRGKPVFPDYRSALENVAERARNKRIVLAIDEFPYLAKSRLDISSLLQTLIDQKLKKTRLFIILCGSSLSFMENQVLGYQSPLYGRRTAQFKIEPFNFFETARFYSRFTIHELAVVYGIIGGVPLYLEKIDDRRSLGKNITSGFFKSSAYLFEEPANLLKQEVRDPANYNAIIKVISDGSTRLGEIAGKVSLETSACAAYLKNLIDLGIVKKEQPIGDGSTRRGIYVVSDHLFRFWYRFIPPHVSMIQNGMGEEVWRSIKDDLSCYMGHVFEDICRQYLWRENAAGRLPIPFTELGRWWGNDPRKKSEAEMDILALSGKRSVIFGECKWTDKAVDAPVLELLAERADLFPSKDRRFYLFAKQGFTARCRELADSRGDATLVTLKDML